MAVEASSLIRARTKEERLRALLRLTEITSEASSITVEAYKEGDPEKALAAHAIAMLAMDLSKQIMFGKDAVTERDMILPGGLWIIRNLVNGRLSVEGAVKYLVKIRRIAGRIIKFLNKEKNLLFLVPDNTEPTVYCWVDKIGITESGKPMYALTLFFKFDFDISELDNRREYEPVTFYVIDHGNRLELVKICARVHYKHVEYDVRDMNNITILFTRWGHTPVVLDVPPSKIRIIEDGTSSRKLPLVGKPLSKFWIHTAPPITKLAGVKEFRLDGTKLPLVTPALPAVDNNPFETKIYPQQKRQVITVRELANGGCN